MRECRDTCLLPLSSRTLNQRRRRELFVSVHKAAIESSCLVGAHYLHCCMPLHLVLARTRQKNITIAGNVSEAILSAQYPCSSGPGGIFPFNSPSKSLTFHLLSLWVCSKILKIYNSTEHMYKLLELTTWKQLGVLLLFSCTTWNGGLFSTEFYSFHTASQTLSLSLKL